MGSEFEVNASFSIEWTHRLRCTQNAFQDGGVLDEVFCELQPLTTFIVVDEGLFSANASLRSSLLTWQEKSKFATSEPLIITGGESAKNNIETIQTILDGVNTNNVCRKSCIFVIGGGAVLDVVGYAASIAHRGIPLVRMPSTTLSQGDSGVGVKNGVNQFGKKNFLGVFDPPYAVINDYSLLETLDDVHWRSGLSEAIKVALIKDVGLLEEIETNKNLLLGRDLNTMASILQQSAILHLQHITGGGDPFERLNARPLDFGHWAAHKLEPLTDYTLSHGDAVAIGLAIDLRCSVLLGLLDNSIARRTISLLQQLGFPTNHPELLHPDLMQGIEEFRQHLGGNLTLLMLEGLEKPIDIHQLDENIVRQAIDELM